MPPRYPSQSPLSRDSRAVGIAAAILSLLWLAGVFGYYFTSDSASTGGAFGLVMVLLIALVPIGLIWAAVIGLGELRALRAEAAELHASLDALQTPQPMGSAQTPPKPEPRLEEPLMRGRGAATAAGSFASRRDSGLSQPSADRRSAHIPAQPEPEADEPGLALGTPPDSAFAPIAMADLIAALQFPNDADDHEGIRAMRFALQDRETAKLIRSTQDVLTLLSQEGVFMDNLPPDLCHPDLWRRFAAGERGAAVAAVGGIRDRASLALAAVRMREDMIFRDAAHHFLRTFDRFLQKIEPSASDAELIALADSRTARAFMVLGRVAGVFD